MKKSVKNDEDNRRGGKKEEGFENFGLDAYS
jgi:hypothetical protein